MKAVWECQDRILDKTADALTQPSISGNSVSNKNIDAFTHQRIKMRSPLAISWRASRPEKKRNRYSQQEGALWLSYHCNMSNFTEKNLENNPKEITYC